HNSPVPFCTESRPSIVGATLAVALLQPRAKIAIGLADPPPIHLPPTHGALFPQRLKIVGRQKTPPQVRKINLLIHREKRPVEQGCLGQCQTAIANRRFFEHAEGKRIPTALHPRILLPPISAGIFYSRGLS